MALPLGERIGFAVVLGMVTGGIMTPVATAVYWPLGVVMLILTIWMMYEIITDTDEKRKEKK